MPALFALTWDEGDRIAITWDEKDRPVVRYADGQEDAAATTAVDVDEWVKALVARITDESAENLRALVRANGTRGAIALADLAAELGVDKKKIDGWNRNFGRSVKAVVRDYGFLRKDQEDGTAQVFDFEWDSAGNRWLYIVPERFRELLIRYLDER